ncbi:cellulose synthase/poly-beta-1,6-N-acetylglucosamine synthase-like glycosyltransferase [Pontibacter aydingkolensis]|uniref:Glycosyltransferase n=1 Tax=Pontibacter aydingkolensis TaxID=1911536 RepID=A0ABS7CVX1_9BACT|nr:glycosyltransferase family 2 protein [Pontibacter aydingkolensis]MBW7468018.1 glycosyltransferase [Pontibacter aydingkolensis]
MIVSVAYFILFFTLFLVLLVLLLVNRKRYTSDPDQLPRISILIAARNEGHTITRCLTAIEALDYPKVKIEVLIGNDGSTDSTQEVIKAFIKDKPYYTCINITQSINQLKGKQNVLAQLSRLATSNLYFYTDADIAVPPTWVKGMLGALTDKVGVVTGITTTQEHTLFAKLQALDWLYALGLMQVVSDLNKPVTTMGNNMLLRREAYEDVGGFESIPFSITEDIAIFNKILEKGWGFRNVYSNEVLALSTPATDFNQFMHQRKRWMKGAMHLPVYMTIILVLHSAYYPVLLPFGFHTSAGVVLAVFTAKLIMQSVFLYVCLRRLHRSAAWWEYFVFEIYLVITSIVLLVFYYLPVKTVWKGRKY